MRDRNAVVGATGAVLGIFGVCCGLPVLLSLGFLGAIAGISLRSRVLIILGLVAVALGLWRRPGRRHRSTWPPRHGDRDRDGSEDTDAATNGAPR